MRNLTRLPFITHKSYNLESSQSPFLALHMNNKPAPGVSRSSRLSDEGLQRLDKQLQSGTRISTAVLSQWIRRYGDTARDIIKHHRAWQAELDEIQ